MRLGVDIDDTICRTSEIVHERLEEYSKSLNINPLDIMNDEELKINFFNIYLEDIYSNVEVKKQAVDVLRRLHNKGNEIYLITARSNGMHDAVDITKRWLEKNNIVYDELITSCYGDGKAQACIDYNIDLMIDNDPFNYKQISSRGINCILFDDREKFELKENYITTWLDIEKYIERMK